jgi:TRAP-type C4-dicarboxylate transport system substrate-binding protein
MFNNQGGKVMIKRVVKGIVMMMLLLLMTPAFPVGAAERVTAPAIELTRTYTWKLVSPMSAGQNTNIGIVEFAKQLEQRTGGKVKITLYESTLGAPTDHWDMTKNNAVQFAFTSDMYNASRMPILSMIGLPTEVPEAKDAWVTANEWLKAGYLKELTDNFKVLWFQSSSPLSMYFRKSKPAKQDDFKGMKIRCGGAVQCQAMNVLGASGVSMPGGEVYMALQTGVIDGAITGIDVANDRKFYEVAKNVLRQNLIFGMFVFLMNKETWNSLPPELQKLIDQTAKDVNIAEMERRYNEDKTLVSTYEKRGGEFYSVNKEEFNKWRQLIRPNTEKYVQDLAAKGHPAKEALALMRKVAAQ